MSLDTMAHTTAQGGYQRPKRAASTAAAGKRSVNKQAADTTDADSECRVGCGHCRRVRRAQLADSDDESDELFPSTALSQQRHSLTRRQQGGSEGELPGAVRTDA